MTKAKEYCKYSKWTESMRLKLIDTVITVEEELRRGDHGVTRAHSKARLKWRLVTARMPPDFMDRRVHRKYKWMPVLRSQFFNLRKYFRGEIGPNWWFTGQIYTKMKEYDELMLLEPDVETALGGFCDQGLHDEVSPEAHLSAVEIDEPHILVVAGRQDGRGEHLQSDDPCAPIQDYVSLPRSTDWVQIHDSDTLLPTSSRSLGKRVTSDDASLPTRSRRGKRVASEASLSKSSSSESAMCDGSPSNSLRIGWRYPDKSVGPTYTQRQRTDDSAANRDDEAETSTAKRTRQCQGPDNLSRRTLRPEDVENVSNTMCIENMKSSLFAQKLLKSLPTFPGEGTVEDKLGEVFATHDHRGDITKHRTRLLESTTCLFDRFIHDQQHTKNRVHLIIQARHEELKVRMTEVINQTSNDLLHLLLNLASGES